MEKTKFEEWLDYHNVANDFVSSLSIDELNKIKDKVREFTVDKEQLQSLLKDIAENSLDTTDFMKRDVYKLTVWHNFKCTDEREFYDANSLYNYWFAKNYKEKWTNGSIIYQILLNDTPLNNEDCCEMGLFSNEGTNYEHTTIKEMLRLCRELDNTKELMCKILK